MNRLDGNFEQYKVSSKAGCSEDYRIVVDIDGNECLINSDYEARGVYVYVCKGSGERLTRDDLFNGKLIVDINNNVYSAEWAEDNMVQCEVCGVWFDVRGDEGVITEEDDCFCNHCLDKNAKPCADCGTWHSLRYYEDKNSINCGISGEDMYGDDIYLCENCRTEYYICDECGCLVPYDYINEVDNMYYCPSCFENQKSEGLQRYHYDGDESDYGMEYLGIETRKQNPLMGVEAEMDCGGEDEYKIEQIKEAFGKKYCVCCEDGSLTDGFELISCPANLDHHITDLNWTGAFTMARKLGYLAHDPGTCGLHIHIDRKYFIGSGLSSTEIEGAMFIVLKNNVDWIKKFSRRFKYGYCEINGEDDGETIKNMEDYDKKWSKKEALRKRDRYKALNFSRSDTIEFRIFRGTLNVDTLYATLQFVDIFARLIKRCYYLDDAMDISLESFIDYAGHDPKYKQFVDYCKAIGIVDDNETGY